MEVYVGEAHPFYFVFADGVKIDEFRVLWTPQLKGKALTWSEQWDIANGYKEALTGYVPATRP